MALKTRVVIIARELDMPSFHVGSHIYSRCAYNNIIIRAYNVGDHFHTGRIAPLGMVKIVYIIVCICKSNNNM